MSDVSLSSTLLPQTLAEQLRRAGQTALIDRFAQLTPQQRAKLLAQLQAIDFAWLARVWRSTIAEVRPDEIAPYRQAIAIDDPRRDQARARGEQALAKGEVACLLVAGGSGSRLGFDGPKGAFPLGAVSKRTLFELHLDRLLALGKRYGTVPLLFLMTGPDNHQQTLKLFTDNQNYGYPSERLQIFQQGVAPALDEHGQLLLAEPDSLVLSPNGNGGLFAALAACGAYDRMERAGVKAISYIQVDNALSQSCDPLFCGYHLLAGSQYSCKGLKKRSASEKVGVFAKVNGRLTIVEYYEIPAALSAQTAADGELLFGLANPGLFVFDLDFMRAQAARDDLPFHKAHKKIAHISAEGERITPDRPNGYKLEAFALDTLPEASPALVLICEREEEFAPVKNMHGEDSPETARQLMQQRFARWLAQAGVEVAPGANVEIAARYALDQAELAARLTAGQRFFVDTFLDG